MGDLADSVPLGTTWFDTETFCDFTYELFEVVNVGGDDVTQAYPQTLLIFDSSTGSMVLQGTDVSYDLVTATFMVERTSVLAGTVVSDTFTVEFEDECRQAVAIAPEWLNSSDYLVYVWQAGQEFGFEAASYTIASNSNCGTIVYDLINPNNDASVIETDGLWSFEVGGTTAITRMPVLSDIPDGYDAIVKKVKVKATLVGNVSVELGLSDLFELTISNPCKNDAALNALNLLDMEVGVFAIDPATQTFDEPTFQNIVFPDGASCGAVEYTLLDTFGDTVDTFVTLGGENGRTIIAFTNDDALINMEPYNLLLRVYFTEYDETTNYEFNLKINPCSVTTLTSDVLQTQQYTVKDSPLVFATVAPTLSPTCGYEPDCTVDSDDMEDFMAYEPATRTFTVSTQDNLLDGTYTVVETCTFESVDEYFGVEDLSLTRTQAIVVVSSCPTNQVGLNSGIDNFDFAMGESTPEITDIEADWSETESSCAYSHTLQEVSMVDGDEVLSEANPTLFNVMSVTGVVTVSGKDPAYIGTTTLRLTRISTESQSSAYTDFDVSLDYECNLISLTAPVFTELERTKQLFADADTNSFTAADYMSDHGNDCGTWTYSLLNNADDSDATTGEQLFSIGSDAINIDKATFDDLGGDVTFASYSVYLVATLTGDIEFQSIESLRFELTLQDPCSSGYVELEIVVDDMEVSALAASAETQTFDEPVYNVNFIDGASCGPIAYSLEYLNNYSGEVVVTNTERTIAAKSIELDSVGETISMKLIATFTDYTVNLEYEFDVSVVPCHVTGVSTTEPISQSYTVNSSIKLFSTPAIVQEPACGYQIECTVDLNDFTSPPISYDFSEGTYEFSVITDRNIFDSVYTVTETCTFEGVDDFNGDDNFATVRDQEITIVSSCPNNIITNTGGISDVTYRMGASTPSVDLDLATWENTEKDCTFDYYLYEVSSNSEGDELLNTAPETLFTFDDTTGFISIQGYDSIYYGTTTEFRLSRASDVYVTEASAQFFVTFEADCDFVTIEAPEWIDGDELDVYLYQTSSFSFTDATYSTDYNSECGTFYYQLFNKDKSLATDNGQLFTLNGNQVVTFAALPVDISDGSEYEVEFQLYLEVSLAGDHLWAQQDVSPFSYTVQDPCQYNLEISDITTDIMNVSVLAAAQVTQIFDQPTIQNIMFPQGESCGNIEYGLYETGTFTEATWASLDISTRTIFASVDDFSLVGTTITYALRASFIDYPDNYFDNDLVLEITPCYVTGLTSDALDDCTYVATDSTEQCETIAPIQQPACDYEIICEVDTDTFPDPSPFSYADMEFSVYTDGNLLNGQYSVVETCIYNEEDDSFAGDLGLFVDRTQNIVVSTSCSENVVTYTSGADEVEYQYFMGAETPAEVLTTVWNPSKPDCDISFSLEEVLFDDNEDEAGVEEPNANLFSIDQSTGVVTVQGEDIEYNMKVYTMRITATSTLSGDSDSHDFDIYFEYDCSYVDLVAPTWSVNTVAKYLYEADSIVPFNAATYTTQYDNDCGTLSYEIFYLNMDELETDDLFSLNEGSMGIRYAFQADIDQLVEKIFTLTVRATLTGPVEFGNQMSLPLPVTVQNPCEYTLEFDNFVINNMSTNIKDIAAAVQTFPVPTNNIVFPDGESCGTLEYYLTDSDETLDFDFISLDERTISVQTAEESLIGTEKDMILVVKYENFLPEEEVPFTVVFNACYVTGITSDALEFQEYLSTEVKLVFSTVAPTQTPACGYPISCQVDDSDYTDPPISYVEDTRTFTVFSTSNNVNGMYTVTETCNFEEIDEYSGATLSIVRDQVIEVVTSCPINEITLETSIGNETRFLMGELTTAITREATWTRTEPNCAYEHTLQEKNEVNGEIVLTEVNANLFSVNLLTGVVTISGKDDAEGITTLRLTRTSTDSGSVAFDDFEVELIYECKTLTLTPPMFAATEDVIVLQYAAVSTQAFTPSSYESNYGNDCGAFVYVLRDLDAGIVATFDGSMFSLEENLVNIRMALNEDIDEGETTKTYRLSLKAYLVDDVDYASVEGDNLLTVVIQDPCEYALVFNYMEAANMFITVYGDEQIQQLTDPGNNLILPDGESCGDVIFYVTKVNDDGINIQAEVAELADGQAIFVYTDNPEFAGENTDFMLSIFYDDFTPSREYPFTVNIGACVVIQDNNVWATVSNIDIDLNTNEVTNSVAHSLPVVAPCTSYDFDCYVEVDPALPEDFTFELNETYDLFSWEAAPNYELHGIYNVLLTCELDDEITTLTQTFDLEVYGCALDVVSKDSDDTLVLNDIAIGTAFTYDISANFDHLISECDLEYTIQHYNSDPELDGLEAPDSVSIDVDTGIITFDVTNRGWYNSQHIFDITVQSIDANGETGPSQLTRKIKFKLTDACASYPVLPADGIEMDQTDFEFDMWQLHTISFTRPVVTPSVVGECGEWLCDIAQVIQDNGEYDYVLAGWYTEVGDAWVATLNDDYLGETVYELGCFLVLESGDTVIEFQEIYSEMFTVEIVNPCLETSILPYNDVPQNLFASVLGDLHEAEFPIFQDAASVSYTDDASGHDKCGLQSYEIYTQNSDSGEYDIEKPSYVSLNTNTRTISLQSTSAYDFVGTVNMGLEVCLDDYSDICEIFPFTVTLTACEVISIVPTDITTLYHTVGVPLNQNFAEYTMEPACAYGFEYVLSMVNGDDLPYFITSPEITVLTANFAAVEYDDAGEYEIRIFATAQDSPVFSTDVTEQFTLIVGTGCDTAEIELVYTPFNDELLTDIPIRRRLAVDSLTVDIYESIDSVDYQTTIKSICPRQYVLKYQDGTPIGDSLDGIVQYISGANMFVIEPTGVDPTTADQSFDLSFCAQSLDSDTNAESCHDFTLEIIDPCFYTAFTATNVDNLSTTVFAMLGDSTIFTEFTVDVQNEYPDVTNICGPITYSINVLDYDGSGEFVTLDAEDMTIAAKTTDDAHVNVWDVQLVGTLENYSNEDVSEFSVIIGACVITDYVIEDENIAYKHSILFDDSIMDLTDVIGVQSPTCGYEETYEFFEVNDDGDFEEMMEFVTRDGKVLTVDTQLDEDIDIYQLVMVSTLSDGSETEFYFTLDVFDPFGICMNDVITDIQLVEFYEDAYHVVEGIQEYAIYGSQLISFTFTQTYDICPVTISFSDDSDYSPYDDDIFDFEAEEKIGNLVIETFDDSYDGDYMTIYISIVSYRSTQDAQTTELEIEIRIPCWYAELSLPTSDSPLYYTLWVPQSYDIVLGERIDGNPLIDAYCQDVEIYHFIQDDDDLEFFSTFRLTVNDNDNSQIYSSLNNEEDIGTKIVRIEARYGLYTGSFVQSEDIEIIITDGCDGTEILLQEPLADMNTSILGFADTQMIDVPLDSIFVNYDEIYPEEERTLEEVCGSRTLSVVKASDETAEITYLSLVETSAGAMWSLTLTADESHDIMIDEMHYLVVEIVMDDMTVTTDVFPFLVSIRDCMPSSWTVNGSIYNQFIMTGDLISINLPEYIPYPDCSEETTIIMMSSDDRLDQYFTVETDNSMFSFQTMDHSIYGTFTITIMATNAGSTDTTVAFLITIESCWQDVVTITNLEHDFLNNWTAGVNTWDVPYTHTVQWCELEFSLENMYLPETEDLNPYFTLNVEGQIEVDIPESEWPTWFNEQAYFEFTVTSVNSEMPSTESTEVTILLVGECELAMLTAPTLDEAFTFDRFDMAMIDFTAAVSDTDCGEITYKLYDYTNESYNFGGFNYPYSFDLSNPDMPQLTGMAANWVGTREYEILACNTEGIDISVIGEVPLCSVSMTFTITLTDSCESAMFMTSNFVLENMNAEKGSPTAITQEFPSYAIDPTLTGNIINACGETLYTIETQHEDFVWIWIEGNTIYVQANDEMDLQMIETITFTAYLADYDTATKEIMDFTVNFGECTLNAILPDNDQVEIIEYEITYEQIDVEFGYVFSPADCVRIMTPSIVHYTDNTFTVVDDTVYSDNFLSVTMGDDEISTILSIMSNDRGDDGTYFVQVVAIDFQGGVDNFAPVHNFVVNVHDVYCRYSLIEVMVADGYRMDVAVGFMDTVSVFNTNECPVSYTVQDYGFDASIFKMDSDDLTIDALTSIQAHGTEITVVLVVSVDEFPENTQTVSIIFDFYNGCFNIDFFGAYTVGDEDSEYEALIYIEEVIDLMLGEYSESSDDLCYTDNLMITYEIVKSGTEEQPPAYFVVDEINGELKVYTISLAEMEMDYDITLITTFSNGVDTFSVLTDEFNVFIQDPCVYDEVTLVTAQTDMMDLDFYINIEYAVEIKFTAIYPEFCTYIVTLDDISDANISTDLWAIEKFNEEYITLIVTFFTDDRSLDLTEFPIEVKLVSELSLMDINSDCILMDVTVLDGCRSTLPEDYVNPAIVGDDESETSLWPQSYLHLKYTLPTMQNCDEEFTCVMWYDKVIVANSLTPNIRGGSIVINPAEEDWDQNTDLFVFLPNVDTRAYQEIEVHADAFIEIGQYTTYIECNLNGFRTLEFYDETYTIDIVDTCDETEMEIMLMGDQQTGFEVIIEGDMVEFDIATNWYTGCDISFEVVFDPSPDNLVITYEDTSEVDVSNSFHVTVQTDDLMEMNNVYTMTVYYTNNEDNEYETMVSTDITILHICQTLTHIPAGFDDQANMMQDIFFDLEVMPTESVIPDGCGDVEYFLYEMVDGVVTQETGIQYYFTGDMLTIAPIATSLHEITKTFVLKTATQYLGLIVDTSTYLEVSFHNPCFDTALVLDSGEVVIDDMFVPVESTATQNLPVYVTQVSVDKGVSLCGGVSYQILDSNGVAWDSEIRRDGLIVIVSTFDEGLISLVPYSATLRVYVTNYPINSWEDSFNVFFTDCIVSGIDTSAVDYSTLSLEYIVGQESTTMDFPIVAHENCDYYEFSWMVEILDTVTLEVVSGADVFVSMDLVEKTFTVDTNEIMWTGSYTLRLTAYLNDPLVTSTAFDYDLTIIGCSVSTIELFTEVVDFHYDVVATGVSTSTFTATSSVPGCNVSWEVVIDPTGDIVPEYVSASTEGYTFSFVIDLDVLDDTRNFVIKAVMDGSGDLAQTSFTVEFIDFCQTAPITNFMVIGTDEDWRVFAYAQLDAEFTVAMADYECAITYDTEMFVGTEWVSASETGLFTVDASMTVSANGILSIYADGPTYAGVHQLRLKASSYVSNWVLSEEFMVTIQDTCLNTEFDLETLVGPLVAVNAHGAITQQYAHAHLLQMTADGTTFATEADFDSSNCDTTDFVYTLTLTIEGGEVREPDTIGLSTSIDHTDHSLFITVDSTLASEAAGYTLDITVNWGEGSKYEGMLTTGVYNTLDITVQDCFVETLVLLSGQSLTYYLGDAASIVDLPRIFSQTPNCEWTISNFDLVIESDSIDSSMSIIDDVAETYTFGPLSDIAMIGDIEVTISVMPNELYSADIKTVVDTFDINGCTVNDIAPTTAASTMDKDLDYELGSTDYTVEFTRSAFADNCDVEWRVESTFINDEYELVYSELDGLLGRLLTVTFPYDRTTIGETLTVTVTPILFRDVEGPSAVIEIVVTDDCLKAAVGGAVSWAETNSYDLFLFGAIDLTIDNSLVTVVNEHCYDGPVYSIQGVYVFSLVTYTSHIPLTVSTEGDIFGARGALAETAYAKDDWSWTIEVTFGASTVSSAEETVIVTDPCLTTEYASIDTLEFLTCTDDVCTLKYLSDSAIMQNVQYITTVADTTYSGTDLCGSVNVVVMVGKVVDEDVSDIQEINSDDTQYNSWITVGTDGLVTIEPTTSAEIGKYIVYFSAELSSYSDSGRTQLATYDLNVEYCDSGSFTEADGWSSSVEYLLDNVGIQFVYPTYYAGFECGYEMKTSVSYSDVTQCADQSLVVDTYSSDTSFTFQSNDSDKDLKVCEIVITTGIFEGDVMQASSSNTLMITQVLTDVCYTKTVTDAFVESIDSQYYIGDTTLVSLATVLSVTTDDGCGISFRKTQTGQNTGIHDDDFSIVVEDGVNYLQILTTDTALWQTTKELTIEAWVTNNPGGVAFAASKTVSVTYRSYCEDSISSEAYWGNSSGVMIIDTTVQDLNNGDSITYDFVLPGLTATADCGVLVYTLVGAPADGTHTIDTTSSTSKATVTFNVPSVVDLYTVTVTYANDYASGTIVNSLDITVTDQCETVTFKEIDLDTITTSVMLATGSEYETVLLADNGSKIEDAYGAGVCGTILNYITVSEDTFVENENAMIYLFQENERQGQFYTAATETVNVSLFLWRELKNYPAINDQSPITVRVTKCVVTDISTTTGVTSFSYPIGEDKDDYVKSFMFTQSPACDYDFDYSFTVADSNGDELDNDLEQDIDNDPFLFIDANNMELYTDTEDQDYAGTYTITVTADIEGEESAFSFQVTLIGDGSGGGDDDTVNSAPYFEDLSDNPQILAPNALEMLAGETIKIEFAGATDDDEDDLDNLVGTVSSTVSFINIEGNVQDGYKITIDAGATNNDDIGIYTVTISVEDDEGAQTIYQILISIINNETLVIVSGNNSVDPNSFESIFEEEEASQIQTDNGLGEQQTAIRQVVTDDLLVQIVGPSNTGKGSVSLRQNKFVVPEAFNGRRLQQSSASISDYITIEYESAIEGKDVGFQYEITSFTEDSIDFQLIFDDARQVSNSIDNDAMAVKFASALKTEAGTEIPAQQAFKKDVIRQIAISSETENIENGALGLQIAIIVWSVLVAFFFLYMGKGNITYLYSFICSTQMLMHLPLINVNLPGNAAYFMNTLMKLGRFEFFENTWLAELTGVDKDYTNMEQFEQAGYESYNTIINCSVLSLLVCVMVIAHIICGFLKAATFKCADGKIKSAVDAIADRLWWGYTVRFIALTYLPLMVASVHNMKSPVWNVSKAFSLFIIFVYGAFTLMIVAFQMYGMCGDKNRNDHRAVYGFIGETFFIRKGDTRAHLYVTTFFMRRLLFAIVTCFMPNFYAGQVFVMLVTTCVMAVQLHRYCPFGPRDQFLNSVALISEFFIFMATINMVPASNMTKNVDTRETIGLITIVIVAVAIIFNLVVLTGLAALMTNIYFRSSDVYDLHNINVEAEIAKAIDGKDAEKKDAEKQDKINEDDLAAIQEVESEKDLQKKPKEPKAEEGDIESPVRVEEEVSVEKPVAKDGTESAISGPGENHQQARMAKKAEAREYDVSVSIAALDDSSLQGENISNLRSAIAQRSQTNNMSESSIGAARMPVARQADNESELHQNMDLSESHEGEAVSKLTWSQNNGPASIENQEINVSAINHSEPGNSEALDNPLDVSVTYRRE